MSAVLKEAQGNLKNFGTTATEAGEKSSIFGGILDGVFGSWPAKVAEGVLLRDMVHELITVVKDGAIEFGLMGSEVNTLHEGMARLAGGVVEETAILNAMREGVKGTINDVQLMTQANKLMATGALKNADDFGTLTQASRVLSREGFGSIQEVMGTVSNAMEMGRARRLALMGVTIDTARGETEYAKTLGLTRDELTTAQRLYADRITIMSALEGIVGKAGIQETNLKERIQATSVSIRNWTDDLAGTIAKSPQVVAAYDAIQQAIFGAFGGDSKKLSEEFLGWVNEAADAARRYGPIVVQWLKSTADNVIEIWHAVERAWDAVPQWFKNIAEEAALAGGAVYVVSKALEATTSGGILSNLANLAQIWSALRVEGLAMIPVYRDIRSAIQGLSVAETVSVSVGALGSSLAAFALSPAGIAIGLIAMAGALYLVWERFNLLGTQAPENHKYLAGMTDDFGKLKLSVDDAKAAVEKLPMPDMSKPIFIGHGQFSAGDDDGRIETEKVNRQIRQIVDDTQKEMIKATQEGMTARLSIQRVEAAAAIRTIEEQVKGEHLTDEQGAELRAATLKDNAAKLQAIRGEAHRTTLEDIAKINQDILAAETKHMGDSFVVKQRAITQAADYEIAVMLKTMGNTADFEAKKMAILVKAEGDRQRVQSDAYVTANAEFQKSYGERFALMESFAKTERDALVSGMVAEGQWHDETVNLSRDAAFQAANAMDVRVVDTMRGLELLKTTHKDVYDKILADVRANADEQLRIQQGGNLTTIELLEKVGYKTKETTTAAAEVAMNNFNAMKASGVFSAQEIARAWKTAWEEMHPDLIAFHAELDAWAATLTQLATVSGDSFDGVVKDIAQVVVAWNAGAKAADDYAEATTKSAKAMAAVQGVTAMISATEGGGTKGAVGGAVVGAEMGMAIAGPWGAAAGAAIGFVVGLIRTDHSLADVARDAGEKFGIVFSEATAKAIHADIKAGMTEMSAELKNLSLVIADAGGLTDKNLGTMEARLHDVFSMIETHQMTIAQGAKVMDDNFAAFAKAGTNSLGLLDKSLTDIIALNDRFGMQSKAIADYVAGQVGGAGKGIGAALAVPAAALKSYDDLNVQLLTIQHTMEQTTDTGKLAKLQAEYDGVLVKLNEVGALYNITKIHSQEAADAVASSLMGIVGANMKVGISFIDAVRGIAPSVESLGKQLETTGFTGGAAFEFIQKEVALANDKIAGPALAAIEGYTAGMVGLSNAGLLNQDTFAGLAGQIAATEAALLAQGYTSDQVMPAMQGDLQTIWELQQRYGYQVDETTQKLLDEAQKTGLVGEAHKSASERMVDGINHVVDRLDALLVAMGVTLPAAVNTAASAVSIGAGQMVDNLDRVHKAATEVAEGRSPSGIQQITVRTKEAQAAIDAAALAMITQFDRVHVAATGASTPLGEMAKKVAEYFADFNDAPRIISNATAAQIEFVRQAIAAGMSVKDIATALGTTETAVSLAAVTGKVRDHIAAFTDAQRVVDSATQAEKDFVKQAMAAGVSVQDIALMLHTTVEAVTLYEKQLTDAAAVAKTFADTQNRVSQTLWDSQHATEDLGKLSYVQLLFIENSMKAGVSVQDIALMLGTTTQAVSLYEQQLTDAAAATKKFDQAQKDAVTSLNDLMASTRAADLASAASAAVSKLGQGGFAIGGKADSAQASLVQARQTLADQSVQKQLDAAGLAVTVATKAGADVASQLTTLKGLIQQTAVGSAEEAQLLTTQARLMREQSSDTIALTTAKAEQVRLQLVLDDLKNQHLITNTRDQFTTEVNALGMIPAEYARTYNAATDAVKASYADQVAVLSTKQADALALLGPVPATYSATYQNAVDAVGAKYNILLTQTRNRVVAEIEALGPIPSEYNATYTKAFGLVTDKYNALLTALGVTPNLPTMATFAHTYEATYTAAFEATAQRHRELIAELERLPGVSVGPAAAPWTPGPAAEVSYVNSSHFAGGVMSWANADVLYAATHQSESGGAEWSLAQSEAIRRGLAQHFAAGGLVTQYLATGSDVGPFIPSGSDTVPAMLTPGERVLSVKQNKDYEAGSIGSGSDALLYEFRQQRLLLPDQIARAVRDAIILGSGTSVH